VDKIIKRVTYRLKRDKTTLLWGVFLSFIFPFVFQIPSVQSCMSFIVYDTPLPGVVNGFIVVFTAIICCSIWIVWRYGGHKAFIFTSFIWNFEIMTYITYSGKWEYVIELINILVFILLYSHDKESPVDKTERERRELEVENHALERFKGMYNHMFEDFRRKAVIDSKQDLQSLEFSWQSMMQNILKSDRHDLKNKFNELGMGELDKFVYEQVISPFKNKVLLHLEQLPTTMDIEIKESCVADLYKIIFEKFPPSFFKTRWCEFNYYELPSKEDWTRIFCKSNDHRLYSIVLNLISNSRQAIERKKDDMRETGRPYKGKVDVCFFLDSFARQQFLTIQVSDNAGGFSEDILNKIYKERILSADKTLGSRHGEGTQYISFFVQYLGGKIYASNYENDIGEIGARTQIMFPIVKVGQSSI